MNRSEQEKLLDDLDVFKIQGRDRRGRNVLRIIGKFFPAQDIDTDVLKKYMEDKIYPKLREEPFTVLYVHTGVRNTQNFPGILALKSIYDAIPVNVKNNVETICFLHPTLQSRLLIAAVGRLLFAGEFYSKLKYVTRVEFLREHLKRKEMKLPGFVYDHDAGFESRPRTMTDYELESDYRRTYRTPVVDPAVSVYSMRCLA